MITKDNAIERLMNIGFDKENATFILDLEQANIKLDDIPAKLRDNYNRLEKVITKGYFDGTFSGGR